VESKLDKMNAAIGGLSQYHHTTPTMAHKSHKNHQRAKTVAHAVILTAREIGTARFWDQ
jgi:hypothetical protein